MGSDIVDASSCGYVLHDAHSLIADSSNQRSRFGVRTLVSCVVAASGVLAVGLAVASSTVARNGRMAASELPNGGAFLAAIAGEVDSSDNKIPWLRITSDLEAPPRLQDWVARVCTPMYEGPHCANTTKWRGTATLAFPGVGGVEAEIESVKMHTRGHVSAMFPKHQFSLKMPSATSLFGMAPAEKWVLATSFIDTTYQRNPTAFDIYRRLGGWATQTRYVNLEWNGKDFGLYYVGERIERKPGRVEIPKAHPKHPEKSGYLLTIDWAKAGMVSFTGPNTSTIFSVEYPKKKKMSQAQQAFLSRLVNEVDSRAATVHESQALTGAGELAEVLDFESFARYFITEELAKDVDGYAFSDFVTVKDGRLFHAAPWDFDLAFDFACMPVYFRNAFTGNVQLGEIGWNVENLRDNALWIGKDGAPGGAVWKFGMNKRQLFLNIWQHPSFISSFVSQWRAARRGPISDQALMHMVASRSEQIQEAAERDLAIWKDTNRTGFWTPCWPGDGQDFQTAHDHLSQYLVRRASWIDANVGNLLMSRGGPSQ